MHLTRNLKQETRNITRGDIFSISLPKLSFMKAIALTLPPGERLVSWLGGISKVKRTIHSDFDILSLGDNGISKASAEFLAAQLGMTRKAFAEEILDISVKTLERKKPADKLDKRVSSHILEIAKVMDHGLTVFEDRDKIKKWLHKENKALNNMKPVHLFNTLTGLNLVNDVLGRIEEGVYS